MTDDSMVNGRTMQATELLHGTRGNDSTHHEYTIQLTYKSTIPPIYASRIHAKSKQQTNQQYTQ